MADPTEVTVSITDNFFTIDLSIEDETLIASVLLGLGAYVKKGFSIKVRQSYKTFSGSQEIVTKVISRAEQVAEWGKETKQIISALRRR
ncbi:MAG: hypothetical protein PVG99_04480 [Desulfobacteraceae bacterium]|jgi:hypothetical protein